MREPQLHLPTEQMGPPRSIPNPVDPFSPYAHTTVHDQLQDHKREMPAAALPYLAAVAILGPVFIAGVAFRGTAVELKNRVLQAIKS
jgi:hypothetical protein